MEEQIAVLMADLSGYTALTETHGAMSAANLVDKYISIVENCLVGKDLFLERTGDEVMIISSSPDDLLSTALKILQNSSEENNFLLVHGGLHAGKAVKRNNSYFGSVINVTARIAAKANPGTFWCSDEFFNGLNNPSTFEFNPQGKHRFKNLTEEKEMKELAHAGSNNAMIDPVCRMIIKDDKTAVKHPEKDHLLFCSKTCLHIYQDQPDVYNCDDRSL
jgi:class 3 adenylate cyclase/YHS domain-containing protein